MKYIRKKIQSYLNKSDFIEYKNICKERKLFIQNNRLTDKVEHLIYGNVCHRVPKRNTYHYIVDKKIKDKYIDFLNKIKSFDLKIKRIERYAYEEKENIICKNGNIISSIYNVSRKKNLFIILKKEGRDHYQLMSLTDNSIFHMKWHDIVKYYDLDEISQ